MTFQSADWERIFKNFDQIGPVELVKSFQRLIRERTFFEGIFNILQEGVLVLNAEGYIYYANPASMHLFNIQKASMNTLTLGKIAPDLMTWVHQFSMHPESDAWSRHEIEINYPEKRFLRVYATHFHNPEDFQDTTYLALIFNDVTQEKAQAEAFVEEEKLASVYTLAGGVAHEIGNPLNSISLHLELIKQSLAKPAKSIDLETANSSLEVCQNELDRLHQLVEHWLKALRPLHPDFQDIDLWALLMDVLQVQKITMENLGIQVILDISETLPVIYGDPILIKQVIFNLLKNALEAMEAGGTLTLTPYADDEYVFLKIQDTGSGILPEAIPQLFMPYYTTKNEGHGLGLTLAMRILKAHGGTLQIQSTPGKGTCFIVQLPQKHKRVRLLAVNEGV